MFSSFKKLANDFVNKVDDAINKIQVADPLLERKNTQKQLQIKKEIESQKKNKENLHEGVTRNKSSRSFANSITVKKSVSLVLIFLDRVLFIANE